MIRYAFAARDRASAKESEWRWYYAKRSFRWTANKCFRLRGAEYTASRGGPFLTTRLIRYLTIGQVQFHWKDYRNNSEIIRSMTLDGRRVHPENFLFMSYQKAFSAFATMAFWQTA